MFKLMDKILVENSDEEMPHVDEEIFQILSSSPDVIERIFRNLNLRNLLSSRRVCKNWKFYAEKILSERQGVRTLMARENGEPNSVAIGDDSKVQEFFKDIDIYPSFVLLFGKLPLPQFCDGDDDAFGMKRLTPPNCSIMTALTGAGVIGPSETGKLDAFQNPRKDCISCMVFPRIDGLTIRHFELSLEQSSSFSPETADLDALFGIPAEERVKCLLLICPSHVPPSIIDRVFAAFWLREQGRIALCGGCVENTIEVEPGDGSTSGRGLVGIAFCGDERVSAGSVVIPRETKSKRAVGNLLRQFPPLVTPSGRRGTRFGIAFTCAGRGSQMFKTASTEAELIRAQFPDTPIIGVFSMGECGVTYWPGVPVVGRAATAAGSLVGLPGVIHKFTTVVTVITIDH